MTSSALIYLASASPRRHEILNQMGVRHDVLLVPAPAGEDEPQLQGEIPEHYVRRTARDKALRAKEWVLAQSGPQRGILSADTTVALDGNILGKPADADEAVRMLTELSGNIHSVYTAVVLTHNGQTYEAMSVTQVRMSILSTTDIERYCATGEPLGKAGSYAIQGRAARFIEYICGSYTGVMGLPIFETHRLLASAGLA